MRYCNAAMHMHSFSISYTSPGSARARAKFAAVSSARLCIWLMLDGGGSGVLSLSRLVEKNALSTFQMHAQAHA